LLPAKKILPSCKTASKKNLILKKDGEKSREEVIVSSPNKTKPSSDRRLKSATTAAKPVQHQARKYDPSFLDLHPSQQHYNFGIIITGV
jgi:hypothetical protein